MGTLFNDLSEDEKLLIGECLHAAAEGPFFPDWEFDTLFGVQRADVASLAARWPDIDGEDETVTLAVQNSLTNLLGYPHGEDASWAEYISGSRTQVEALLRKLDSNPSGAL